MQGADATNENARGGRRLLQQITLTVQTGNDFIVWGNKDEANATVGVSNPVGFATGCARARFYDWAPGRTADPYLFLPKATLMRNHSSAGVIGRHHQ